MRFNALWPKVAPSFGKPIETEPFISKTACLGPIILRLSEMVMSSAEAFRVTRRYSRSTFNVNPGCDTFHEILPALLFCFGTVLNPLITPWNLGV